MLGQPIKHTAYENLRHRRAAGHADGRHTYEPGLIELGGLVDQAAVAGAVLQRDLDEAHGVG